MHTEQLYSADNERHAQLIKLPEVMARTALSRSEIYRRIQSDPRFPKPLKLGMRSIAFSEREVNDFVIACIAARSAKVGAV